MKEKTASLKKTARVAGLFYLILFCTVVYAHMYVPLQLFVSGDAKATSHNILANEFLFRTCIVVSLTQAIIFLFLQVCLYRLFKDVNNQLAGIMVALAGVQIPAAFVLNTLKFSALMILKGEMPGTISPELAMLFLQITRYGNEIIAIFGGLWLLPFGLLAYKSRFIPRVFGLLLMVAGTGSTLNGLLVMLSPDIQSPQVLAFIFFGLGEISMMLWLIIKGIKDHVSIEIISETNTTIIPSAVKMKTYRE